MFALWPAACALPDPESHGATELVPDDALVRLVDELALRGCSVDVNVASDDSYPDVIVWSGTCSAGSAWILSSKTAGYQPIALTLPQSLNAGPITLIAYGDDGALVHTTYSETSGAGQGLVRVLDVIGLQGLSLGRADVTSCQTCLADVAVRFAELLGPDPGVLGNLVNHVYRAGALLIALTLLPDSMALECADWCEPPLCRRNADCGGEYPVCAFNPRDDYRFECCERNDAPGSWVGAGRCLTE